MARCIKCGARFKIGEARNSYYEYVDECGYTHGFPDFDEDYCLKCNCDNLDWCMPRLNNGDDDDEEDDPGVYRSYDDWKESGEPVDPADDAVWLHDQE